MRRTDEEHVARLRRSVESFDRARPWLLALWLVEAVAWVGLLIGYLVGVSSWLNRGPRGGGDVLSAWIAALIGLSSGFTLGFIAVHLGHALVTILLGQRNQRLLLRYHDELAALRGEKPEPVGREIDG